MRDAARVDAGSLLLTDALADEFKLTPPSQHGRSITTTFLRHQPPEGQSHHPGDAGARADRTHRAARPAALRHLTPYVYWDDSNLNSVDQDYSGRASLPADAPLARGGRSGRAVDHQPDRDILTTGLAYGDNRRIQQRYGGNAAWMFTELHRRLRQLRLHPGGLEGSTIRDIEDEHSNAVTLGLRQRAGGRQGRHRRAAERGLGPVRLRNVQDRLLVRQGRRQTAFVGDLHRVGGCRRSLHRLRVRRPAAGVRPAGVLAVVTEQESRFGLGRDRPRRSGVHGRSDPRESGRLPRHRPRERQHRCGAAHGR